LGTFVMAAAIALGIAWLTAGFQAVKAARANPVESLRYE
jgi:putative ABC transport system permease protein